MGQRQGAHVILHDPEDQFVPFVHAERGAQRISTARLCAFQFAGRILWLGADAKAMHKARLDVLRGSDLVDG